MNLIKAPNGWMCAEDPGEPGSKDPRWSIAAGEGDFLANIFKGLTVLEIGTGLGVSTNAIAKKAKKVYTVDVDDWVRDNIAQKLMPNVVFTQDISKVPNVDAAFIDSLHTYEQCLIDINDCKRLVKKGGVIVLHDAKFDSVVRAANDSDMMFFEIITEAGLAIGWNYASGK